MSHFSPEGSIHMVDVSTKAVTERSAKAEAIVRMSAQARDALRGATLKKGDALAAAQIAGIAAAKQTGTLIPLAHTLPLSSVSVAFEWRDEGLRIETEAKTAAQTGVEMEALVAAAVAALTIYDMIKGIDRAIVVERVTLLEKRGGKSGEWRKP